MSLPLRTLLIPLGLAALACSIEAPTSPSLGRTGGPDALVTPNGTTQAANCTYLYTAGATFPYAVTIGWSGFPVKTISLYTTAWTQYPLRHPSRKGSQNYALQSQPTAFKVVSNKGVELVNQSCDPMP